MTDSPPIEFTAVITTHSEGALLRPTVRSVMKALDPFLERGLEVELLFICDTADERTSREVDHWIDRQVTGLAVRRVDVTYGESGASRRRGVAEASGTYVALVDGDDLVSDDYLVGAFDLLRTATSPTVAHPHYVISFGARSLLWETDSTDSHEASYLDLIRHNLWPSSSVARRELYAQHPFRSLPPDEGYGPEDWIWNIDTTAAGVRHTIVPHSVFFYRVRETGGVNNGHATSVLPPFDLEGLRRHLPVHDASAATSRRSLGHRVYAAARPVARWSTRWLSFEVKHALYRTARFFFRLTGQGRVHKEIPPRVRRSLRDATELEPAISWTAYAYERLERWHARDDGYARILVEAAEQLVANGSTVAVPWLGVGGADMVALNYARALADRSDAANVNILTTFTHAKTIPSLVPPPINLVQLPDEWLHLPPHLRRRLIAQLVAMTRPQVIVSVNCFHMTEALSTHATQILDGTKLFATLFAFDPIGDDGYPVNPITNDGQRLFLDQIGALITDNTASAARIGEMLALEPPRLLVHRQPALDETPALDRTMRAFQPRDVSAERPLRLVWPHRIDKEKGPDAVIAIAERLSAAGIPATIDVWGQPVVHGDSAHLISEMKRAGVVYRGPYAGGLPALPLHDYDAMLLTSRSEGLPLAVVQAMLLGLPVVAAAVGGVPDIVRDGITGLTAAGPDDIDGFVDAIARLVASPALRRSLAEEAYAFAAARHSWAQFDAAVDEMLR